MFYMRILNANTSQVKLLIIFQYFCQYKLSYIDTLRVKIDGFLQIPLPLKKSTYFEFHCCKSVFLRSQTDPLKCLKWYNFGHLCYNME